MSASLIQRCDITPAGGGKVAAQIAEAASGPDIREFLVGRCDLTSRAIRRRKCQ
jgi:hypothetical protein